MNTKGTTPSLCRAIWMGFSLLLVATIAPAVAQYFIPEVLNWLYKPFHSLCHQKAERSFNIAGVPLAVCARCLGIFTGIFAAAIFSDFKKQLPVPVAAFSGLLFSAAVTGNFIQWLLDVLSLTASPNSLRFILGVFIGTTCVLFIRYSSVKSSTHNLATYGT